MNQRESRYVTAAKIAFRLTSQALPKYSHTKSPHHFELPILAACVLKMFYLDLSYRDMEEWLLATDRVCQVLGLKRVPDHTTLQRTFKKLRNLEFEKMKNQILEEESIQEGVIASDSTGFFASARQSASAVIPRIITQTLTSGEVHLGSLAPSRDLLLYPIQ